MTIFARARAVGGPGLPINLEEAGRAFRALADPDSGCQLTEIPTGRRACLKGSDVDGLCEAARGLMGGSRLYLRLNPVPVGHVGPTPSAVILRRRWLMVDVDAARPNTKVSATDGEHRASREGADRVRDYLSGLGWPAPLLIDTGNGHSLLYRIDLANDEAARTLCGNVLRALALRLNEELVGSHIDTATFKATQEVKLPGSQACKGENSPERPWRPVRLIGPTFQPEVVPVPKLAELAAPLEQVNGHAPNIFARARAVGSHDDPEPYARRAFEAEVARLASQAEPGRHNQAYRSAAAVGNYVVSGRLDYEEVRGALIAAALGTGLPEREARKTVEDGLRDGMADPRPMPESHARVRPKGAAPVPHTAAADVATIHDLIAAGSQVTWLWPDWLQIGVLTAIAAPAGTGKTRFCADLLRRIRHGQPWPDGQAIGLPVDTVALWVVSDNHHDEMVTLAQAFGLVDGIRINASKADPYGGVSLETPEDLAALEGRIKAVRPLLVVVDTVGNATDKNLSRQEDAKAFYFPLQVLARRYRCAVLCLTHLNAGGQFLGRRVLEKVRVAIRIEQPDPEGDRRRLEVVKSNSKKPRPLGMVMGDGGNEYDDNPPKRPEESAGARQEIPAKVRAAMDWLKAWLSDGARKVGMTRDAAERAGFTTGTIYRAMRALCVEEFETEGRKWWRLAEREKEF